MSAEARRSKLSFQTIQTASVFILLIALCVYSSLKSDTFFTWANESNSDREI